MDEDTYKFKECYDDDGNVIEFNDWYQTTEARECIKELRNDYPELDDFRIVVMLYAWYKEQLLNESITIKKEDLPNDKLETEMKAVKVYDDIVDYSLNENLKPMKGTENIEATIERI